MSVEHQALGRGFTLSRFTCTGDSRALIAACRDADCILTDYTPFTAHVISQLTACKLISVAASGYGCIDVGAAADAGISVCAVSDYCTDEVADHTLMLILALARKLRAYDRQVQVDRLWRFDTEDGLLRLRGLTLAIVGLGRIGQAVAQRAAGFGMNIVAHDPKVDTGIAEQLGVDLCALEQVWATADVISLHCPTTAENHHLINRDAFNAMQNKPMLINVARGALIDEHALVEALDSGQVSAFGGDVLESESPDLTASALLNRDNVLLTPHVAFYSDHSLKENRRISAANVRHFFSGEHDKVQSLVVAPTSGSST